MDVLKKFRIIILICILTIIIGRISYVNRIYPQVKYCDVKMNESYMWNESKLCISKATVMSSDEATNEYGESIVDGMDDNIDFKLIKINAVVTNDKSAENTVYLYDLYFENSVYANGIAGEVQTLTNTDKLDIDLKPYEERNIELCYIVYENQFNKAQWKHFNLADFYISGEYYPIKKRWHLI